MARQEALPGPKTGEGRPRRKHSGKGVLGKVALAGLTVTGALATYGAIRGVQEHGLDVPAITEDIKDSILKTGGQIAVDQNTRSGAYEMSPVPGRQAESLSSIPTVVNIENIPNIPENDNSIPENRSVVLGALFYEGSQIIVDSKLQINPPRLMLTGYLVAKELQEDGSVLFAIELPNLNSPKDILSKDGQTTTPQLEEMDMALGRNPGEPLKTIKRKHMGGTIVWIRLFDGANPTSYPFATTVAWGEEAFERGGIDSQKKPGSSQIPLAQFARTGDLIRASVLLDTDTNSTEFQDTIDVYLRFHGKGRTAKQVAEDFSHVIQTNASSAQSLIDSAGNQQSIRDQLRSKPHVFTPRSVAFLPK